MNTSWELLQDPASPRVCSIFHHPWTAFKSLRVATLCSCQSRENRLTSNRVARAWLSLGANLGQQKALEQRLQHCNVRNLLTYLRADDLSNKFSPNSDRYRNSATFACSAWGFIHLNFNEVPFEYLQLLHSAIWNRVTFSQDKESKLSLSFSSQDYIPYFTAILWHSPVDFSYFLINAESTGKQVCEESVLWKNNCYSISLKR